MYIKEVNITGFRSYRELTSIKDFSSKHNVVVGRNGSGKSNFFTAIQFVLSNEFSSLSQTDRHAFLHEGVGNRSTVAKVEIVFDNTDRRIPSDNSEVRIMRQVGQKKDEYFIDLKAASRTDVVNMMESAGFSRSNPYYIVKQGKITELATASDPYRLKLIREVAGTRVFDEKKDESGKILLETKEKIESSRRLLQTIEERLKKLEEEKEDLKEYQNYDKIKRAIEYSIYDFEIRRAVNDGEKLSARREEINRDQNRIETQLMEVKLALRENEVELRKLESHFKGTKDERNSLIADHADNLARKTQLELLIKDLSEDVDRERSGKIAAEETLNQLASSIADKQGELDGLKPKFQSVLEEENQLMSEIRIAEQKCKELHAKLGYREQFKSKAERDTYLKKELNFLDRQNDETEDQITKIQKTITEDDKDFERLQSQFLQLTNILHDKSTRIAQMNKQLTAKKADIDRAMTLRMDESRSEKDLREKWQYLQSEISQAEQDLRRLTSRGIMNGIISLNTVLDEFRSEPKNAWIAEGYHGCVIDLISCDSQYNRAVEVIAEGRLFYHVVETDQIAMKILERINRRDLHGEVNFYPLNRIIAKARRPVEDKDVRPMLDYIRYDQKYDVVMRTLFANAVFAKTIIAGQRVAKTERFDCVTLEGDQVSRRGPMTGGYIDVKRSKLELSRRRKELYAERETISEKLEEFTEKLNKSAADIDKIRLEISRLEMDITQLSFEHNLTLEKKRNVSEQINSRKIDQQPKGEQIMKLQSRIKEISARKGIIEQQLNTELNSQLSSNETDEITRLQDDILAKKNQLDTVRQNRTKLDNNIQTLKNQLQSNLLRKRENLSARIESNAVAEKGHRLAAEQTDLKLVNERIMQILHRMDELDNELEDYEKQRERFATSLESNQEKRKEMDAKIDSLAKDADIICTKIATFQAKREESVRKIKDIGTLPSETMGNYGNMSLTQLHKRLTECMTELKKYENVNKKALDQFVRASGQKDELTKRVDELMRNERAIDNLLTVLDNRRYETLQLTFKQVSKNFHDVFKRLIPQGNGDLVMKTMDPTTSTIGNTSSSSAASSTPPPQHVMETFIGVGIQVSFTGTGETREISSLSGGQKSLVALALIFAIQKCDPAPFYLFDEIDAALDQEHRRSVAEMIHELSETAQFITTTFRAELLEHAEKYYGVRFRNKVSYIDPITAEQAYDFVQDDATHS